MILSIHNKHLLIIRPDIHNYQQKITHKRLLFINNLRYYNSTNK
jgi:hypothetical protein